MRIHLIAIGNRMPAWVTQGYTEYALRLPPECALQLTEIAASKRTKNADLRRIARSEGNKLLAAVPKGARIWALDSQGSAWTTEQLGEQMRAWLQDGRDLALLVGGPEGLDAECKSHAERHWSLSPLTLPHPLVRVMVAEQLYRTWSLLNGHPYHR